MSAFLFGNDPLASTADEVARLTRPQREARVVALVEQSRDILSLAVEDHVTSDGRMVAATCVLFSGGNDSTTLAHMFRDEADFFVHANTTIGIEKTREFVRNVSEEWGVELIERMPPREQDRYRAQVLRDGFPGPAWHGRMYTRLKERALDQVRRELVNNPRKERVVFIAGRRRTESQRRSNIPQAERRGSTVWVSPLVNWTKLDLTTYRLMVAAGSLDSGSATCGRCSGSGLVFFSDTDDHDLGLPPDLAWPVACPRCRGNGLQPVGRFTPVPVNEVSDLIHMSGECLCGAFAARGEHAEIAYWFPEVASEIAALEAEIADRDDIPAHRKTWGWGADPAKKTLDGLASKSGLLCSACDERFQMTIDEVAS